MDVLAFRAGKTYSSSEDVAFRTDTIKSMVLPERDEDRRGAIMDALDASKKELGTRYKGEELFNALAELSLKPEADLTWSAGLGLCTILNCRPSDPHNIHTSEFVKAINQKFKQEFATVEKTKKQLDSKPTLAYLCASGNLEALKSQLSALKPPAEPVSKPASRSNSRRERPNDRERRPGLLARILRRPGRQETNANADDNEDFLDDDEEAFVEEYEHPLVEIEGFVGTPLHYAVESNQPECVKAILETAAKFSPKFLKAVLEAPDSAQDTALLKAFGGKNIPCSKVLLEHGADPHRLCIFVEILSPMQYLIRKACSDSSYLKTLQEALQLIDINAEPSNPETGGFYNYLLRLENLMMDDMDDDDEEDVREANPLFGIPEQGHAEPAETPARRRAHRNKYAIEAAEEHNVECLRMLLDAGIKAGADELIAAAKGACDSYSYMDPEEQLGRETSIKQIAGLACIQMLLDRGVDVNATDRRGDTALHQVAHYGDQKVAKFLLDHKANLTVSNKRGKTPIQVAEDCGNTTLVDYFNSKKSLLRLMSSSLSIGHSQNMNEAAEVEPENACVICLCKERSVVLAPCGHRVSCKTCTRKILTERPAAERRCPYCKDNIDSFIVKVFDV